MSYFNNLSEEEKAKVPNQNSLLSEEDIQALMDTLARKEYENKCEIEIKRVVLEDSVKQIKANLSRPKTYEQSTEKPPEITVTWDKDDPTKVHGLVTVYFQCANGLGEKSDHSVFGQWEGTCIDGVFTLTANTIGVRMIWYGF